MIFGKRRHEQTAQQREELKAAAAEQGWRWSDAQPAPAFELSEAALRGPERFKIWTVGLGDVVDGMVNTRPFRAARLIGYDYTTTNGGIPYGDRRETSAVWIDLPDSLPEIRLVDASSTEKDEGLPLPPLNPARTTDGRWRVEGFVPQFASDLLHSTFVTALATLPPLTAVVIRAGMILAYGLQRYDAQTIRTVATTLAALIEAVPGNAWGRADALVAGTGVFPRRVPGGASLSLDQPSCAPRLERLRAGGESAVARRARRPEECHVEAQRGGRGVGAHPRRCTGLFPERTIRTCDHRLGDAFGYPDCGVHDLAGRGGSACLIAGADHRATGARASPLSRVAGKEPRHAAKQQFDGPLVSPGFPRELGERA